MKTKDCEVNWKVQTEKRISVDLFQMNFLQIGMGVGPSLCSLSVWLGNVV